MRRVPIGAKVAAILVVPVLALVVGAGTKMLGAAAEMDEVHDQAELATATLGPTNLVVQLDNERYMATIWLYGLEDIAPLPAEDNEAAWANTDAAVDDLVAAVDSLDREVARPYAPAVTALGGLDDIRQQLSSFTDPRSVDNALVARDIFEAYSGVIDAVFAANAQVWPTITDDELRVGAQLADLSARQNDTTTHVMDTLLVSMLAGDKDGITTPAEVRELSRVGSRLERDAAQIDLLAQGDYRAYADDLFAAEHIQGFPELVDRAIDEGGEVDLIDVIYLGAGGEAGELAYRQFSRDVHGVLVDYADQMRTEADARYERYGLLAVAVIVAGMAMIWLVSRSLTGPLRSLTRQARHMAGTGLPEAVDGVLSTPLGEDIEVPDVPPVTVRSRDEVGDMAEVLNFVHDSALLLAVEQAVLRRNVADSFVNLGRRNQNLLDRQLNFIAEMAAEESDPDTLVSLSRLDHLATRMRRNAESLLVLAGIDRPRRWEHPVVIEEVVGTALAEVDDHGRVASHAIEPVTVASSAAADLAHLVAELVENALRFSPPERGIEVSGSRSRDGYGLWVADRGFGMTAAEITRANRRLAGEGHPADVPSQHLGHHVAGRLAARHGIGIVLGRNLYNGVTAAVHLPPALLVEGHHERLPHPAETEVHAFHARPAAGPPVAAYDRPRRAAYGDSPAAAYDAS